MGDREARHPMGVVSQRTGLSSDVIRAWERRYGVVSPDRSSGGHRLYSDADVEKLRILHRLTLGGRQIGRIADLDDDELTELLREDEAAGATAPGRSSQPPEAADELLDEAIGHVRDLDADALGRTLRRAALALGADAFLNRLLAPLMTRIGEAWQKGTLTPAHEHLASAVSARVSGWLLDNYESRPDAPLIVTSTPQGQIHGLGALSAAVAAAAEGWRVRHLGPNLPWDDLDRVVRATGASVLALSLIHPMGDPSVRQELAELGKALPRTVAWIVGGPAADSYADVLGDAGAIQLESYDELRSYLRRLAA